ncbi:amino acid/polyamine/organocation transporter (APC superfamily) [Streptomyces sp. 1114.5]|nr:amino acid/polyamine/organocation transporter (APC superfamily) [Streptomyces sp. 1114.5]
MTVEGRTRTGDRQAAAAAEVPERIGYRIKRLLLGPPLVTARLRDEKLSKPVALGVLAPDCISSSAYGTEQMLTQLVPVVGVAGFTLVMPVTGVILALLVLLTLSYRDVVMTYTRAGGSYVVARENFGPRTAQVAAVALLIDYIVTVAVQTAAGTDALSSMLRLLFRIDIGADKLWITVGVLCLLCYGNLRGVREAGRAFSVPTYLFVLTAGLTVLVGLGRLAAGDLPRLGEGDLHADGAVPLGTPGGGLLMGASLFVLLRAFANGGSSLTGLEAISNGVGAFREPQGDNARRTLVIMSVILGGLVLGVSALAWQTHAIPYVSGSPTVLAQEAHLVFGRSVLGQAMFAAVQVATALVLYTGANTSFNGFPFLASFVADDSFLPRSLTRRGHRLAFSNGILVLTAVSLALLLVTRGNVTELVSLYAIGVFTGFVMATAGLAKHHWQRREEHRLLKTAVNAAAATASAAVVVVFAVTKFTEGAWVVVILFPLGVWGLIRTNERYRTERTALEAAPATATTATRSRHVVMLLVDRLDLAVLAALSYAHTLRPARLRAVHVALDTAGAKQLRRAWASNQAADVPLDLVECPDRRLHHAIARHAVEATTDGRTQVTLLIPRRSYGPVVGRLLHARSGDSIAHAVSRLPHVVATIVPFDASAAIAEHRRRSRPRDRGIAEEAAPARRSPVAR